MDLYNCESLKAGIAYSKYIIENVPNLTAQELADENKKLADAQKQYEENGCGINLIADKCAMVENQIRSLTNLIATQGALAISDNRIYAQIDIWKKQLNQLKADYELNGCIAEMEKTKQETVQEIASTFKEISKKRVNTIGIYERNKRVFFGAIILLMALALTTTKKKK